MSQGKEEKRKSRKSKAEAAKTGTKRNAVSVSFATVLERALSGPHEPNPDAKPGESILKVKESPRKLKRQRTPEAIAGAISNGRQTTPPTPLLSMRSDSLDATPPLPQGSDDSTLPLDSPTPSPIGQPSLRRTQTRLWNPTPAASQHCSRLQRYSSIRSDMFGSSGLIREAPSQRKSPKQLAIDHILKLAQEICDKHYTPGIQKVIAVVQEHGIDLKFKPNHTFPKSFAVALGEYLQDSDDIKSIRVNPCQRDDPNRMYRYKVRITNSELVKLSVKCRGDSLAAATDASSSSPVSTQSPDSSSASPSPGRQTSNRRKRKP